MGLRRIDWSRYPLPPNRGFRGTHYIGTVDLRRDWHHQFVIEASRRSPQRGPGGPDGKVHDGWAIVSGDLNPPRTRGSRCSTASTPSPRRSTTASSRSRTGVPETPAERQERVVRDLKQLEAQLLAAQAMLPRMVATVIELRELAEGHTDET